MAVRVRYKSLCISLLSSAKQQRETPNSANFLTFCFKFIEVSQIQFHESFDSDKQSKWPKSIPRYIGKI